MRILQSEMSLNVKQRNSIAHKVKRAWQRNGNTENEGLKKH